MKRRTMIERRYAKYLKKEKHSNKNRKNKKNIRNYIQNRTCAELCILYMRITNKDKKYNKNNTLII